MVALWTGQKGTCWETGTVCLYCSCFPLAIAPPPKGDTQARSHLEDPHPQIFLIFPCPHQSQELGQLPSLPQGIFIQDGRGTSPCLVGKEWGHVLHIFLQICFLSQTHFASPLQAPNQGTHSEPSSVVNFNRSSMCLLEALLLSMKKKSQKLCLW